jgi:hypothetical protein
MRYRIIDHIDEAAYDCIMDFAFKNCEYFSVCTFKFYHRKSLKESYFEFLDSAEKFKVEPVGFIMPEHYTKGQTFHVFELNEETRKIIKLAGFNWSAPDYPEDLAFYMNKKVFFSSVSHEQLYLVHDMVLMAMLKSKGIELIEEQ